jgi:hypothetical protein
MYIKIKFIMNHYIYLNRILSEKEMEKKWKMIGRISLIERLKNLFRKKAKLLEEQQKSS